MHKSVLIAEDDPTIRKAAGEYLRMVGWEASEASDGLQARRMLEESPFDVLLTDIRMPGLDGHGLFDWVRNSGPGIPVVFMTAHGDLDDAVRALKRGAADYLAKPFDLDELAQRLERAVATSSDLARLRAAEPPASLKAGRFLPATGPLAQAYALAAKAAATDATVLVQGESGTGKELLARFIHDGSPRRDGPFVAVNAGAIPESLVEGELFGHEKGAFSGAERRRAGYFEAAQRGTIFLDEIGELPLPLQVKLLRVLQERRLNRLGSSVSVPLDIRVLAATNRDLLAMVREGSFREDLYYRLQVLTVRLPPLRERPEDIPGLIAFMLPRVAARLGLRAAPACAPDALAALRTYAFPGNARELENILERALIVAPDVTRIRAADLGLDIHKFADIAEGGPELPGPSAPSPEPNPPEDAPGAPQSYDLASWERYAIERALEHCDGNRSRAAELLGIGRRTLQEKLKAYGPGL